MNNLWEEVGNGCLAKALDLLKKETVPTAATVETVRALVETAISIDRLNLQWELQSRYGVGDFLGLSLEQKATGNSAG